MDQKKAEFPLESSVFDAVRNMDLRIKVVCLSAVFWGVFGHGVILVNKISLMDDLHFFYEVGATYSSGRWFLGLLDTLLMQIFGSPHYSLPLLNGSLSILFLAISAYLFLKIMDIESCFLCIITTGLFVTVPSVAMLFFYTYTAPYYTFAIMLGEIGIYLVCQNRSWYRFIFGVLMLACAIAIYQAYIALFFGVCLLYYIQKTWRADSWKELWREMLYLCAVCISFCIVYLLINNIIIRVLNISMNDYKAISTFGKADIKTYLERLLWCYRIFFKPQYMRLYDSTALQYVFRVMTGYRLVLVLSAILTIKLLVSQIKKNLGVFIFTGLGISVLPLATHFIFILCEPIDVYSLMTYSSIIPFLFLICLLNEQPFKNISKIRFGECISLLGAIVLLTISLMYCRYDNACYLRAEMEQKQAFSYLTVILSQIKNTEGYQDTCPVVFVHNWNLDDSTIVESEEFLEINMLPTAGMEQKVLNYSTKDFLYRWCGFKPVWANENEFKDKPDVVAMPRYPDYGSIKIIDGTVVVKF